MTGKLSVFTLLQSSWRYLSANFVLSACLFVFSFAGIYLAQRFNAPSSLPLISLYLAYTYLFYFFFARIYFNRKPLFDRTAFTNALVRILAVILLAFACILLLKIAIQLLFLIISPLQYIESVRDFALAHLSGLTRSPYFLYTLYGVTFLLLTAIFFIPAFAWVSAVIGGDSSITMTLVRTKGSYLRLFAIFLLIYGLLPFFLIYFSYDSLLVRSAVSAALTVIQFIIYLNIYEFFYPQQK